MLEHPNTDYTNTKYLSIIILHLNESKNATQNQLIFRESSRNSVLNLGLIFDC